MSKKHILIIFLLSFLVYANSLQNEFIWDDKEMIEENSVIRDYKNLPKIFSSSYWFTGPGTVKKGNYRPLTTTSYLFNYQIAGLSPAAFRVVNILLHAVNAVLVYWLAYILGVSGIFALLCGLIFAIHPIHTEAVVWIVGRAEVMGCTFFLAALIASISFHKLNKKPLLLVSLLFYILALLTKETPVSLPFVILLHRLILPNKNWREKTINTLISIAPYVVVTVLYLALRAWAVGGVGDPDNTFLGIYGFNKVFLSMTKIVAYYWWLLLAPLVLKAHYDLVDFPIPGSVFDPGFMFAASVHILILATAAYMLFRKRSTIFFSVLLVYTALLPFLHIIPFSWLMAERFLYLPSIGIALLFGSAAQEINKMFCVEMYKKFILASLIIFIASSYSIRTWYRNLDWKNEVVFFSRMISQTPDLPAAYSNLGYAYFEKGQIDEAIEAYQKALQLKPDYVEAWNSLNYLKSLAPPSGKLQSQ